jgi:3-phosphoshikimate 1-carboxyvinyltransferase
MVGVMSADTYTVQPVQHAINARVELPGSKSYTNRALPLAALAAGSSTISNALFSDDTRYMAAALRQLGILVTEDPVAKTFVVVGAAGQLPASAAELFIGNSGTSARFLTPMLALGHGSYTLDGVAAMQKRPIQPLLDALQATGVDAISLAGSGCPPLQITSQGWRGGHHTMRGDLSSQYFSGLLMSAPVTSNGLTLTVLGDLVSKPYIDITKQAMNAFGADFSHKNYQEFHVPGGQRYQGAVYAIEPDASAASYFFAAAAITGGRVLVPGLGTDSLQGDLKFVRILEQMGCIVRQSHNETEVIGPANITDLRGIEVNMADVSDTAQTLAAIAPFANSPVRITGIGFIRGKETDRVAAMVRELQRLGIDAIEEDDGLLVRPGPPEPAKIETYDDHRMAMSFALVGLRVAGITILDPGCTAKTFPNYFEVLAGLS